MPSHYKPLQSQVKERQRPLQRSIKAKILRTKIRHRDVPKKMREIPVHNLANAFDIRLQPQVSPHTSPTTGIIDLQGNSSLSDGGIAAHNQRLCNSVYSGCPSVPVVYAPYNFTNDAALWYNANPGYGAPIIPDFNTWTKQAPSLGGHSALQSQGTTVQPGLICFDDGLEVSSYPPSPHSINDLHLVNMQDEQRVFTRTYWGENSIPHSEDLYLNGQLKDILPQSPRDGFDYPSSNTLFFNDSFSGLYPGTKAIAELEPLNINGQFWAANMYQNQTHFPQA